MKRVLALAIALLSVSAGLAAAQEMSLPITNAAPKVDGVVGSGEYTVSRDVGGATLSLARTSNRIYAALSAPAEGWVAVGVGALRMNGSRIFIGYVKNGEATFEEQAGRGHSHGDPGDGKHVALAHALTEANGRTTLEVELDAAEVPGGSGGTLDLIVAYSDSDSFYAYHNYRTALTVKLP